MNKAQDDMTLWQGARNGDKNSFEQLFKYYYRFLIHYGLKHTDNENLLEDCAQELFLELWEKAPQTHIQSFRGYLFQSFRFKLYRHLERSRKYDSLQKNTDDDSDFTLSKEDFIISDEEDSEKIDILKKSLEKLSKRQQEIIYLRFYQNLDYNDICEIMGISYQVSRNLLYQSIKALKKDIAPA
ncbi:MAG: sigma-70 family RNA polymerase sigma factor, partial [Bacteroidota bacterium]|nr:sigma-70 family RNA polymerase sigma factor [Bacteroidota bacterium]